MKKVKTILVIILSFVVVAESKGQRQAGSDETIKVDVKKSSYPQKELVLHDFMDVEYVALETNDDFINQGVVRAIGKDLILVVNRKSDGDIFVYDRQGKALRIINRKGQGGEEYIAYSHIVLDEDNGEIFVSDYMTRKILVYDLFGKFKRSFMYQEYAKKRMFYHNMFNYDKNNLITYDNSINNKDDVYVLISKQDGSITKEIKIPVKKKISLFKAGDVLEDGSSIFYGATVYSDIAPFNSNFLLSAISSDTMYILSPDHSLRPFIVKTPLLQSMDPEVALIFRFSSNRYYFMETIKTEFTERGFEPANPLMYDKQEKAFFRYKIYNGDYSIKKEISVRSLEPVNHERESQQILQADQIVESYKKGELKGKLKDIASKLDADDNPVIMLIKHKK